MAEYGLVRLIAEHKSEWTSVTECIEAWLRVAENGAGRPNMANHVPQWIRLGLGVWLGWAGQGWAGPSWRGLARAGTG